MLLEGFELVESAAARPDDLPAEGWIPAAVPGGVHEALIAAGQLEHPYVAENESDAQWVETRIWWYRARFDKPTTEGTHRLVFHGLDTVCEVFLNGERVGGHANMFRPAEWDVTDGLQADNIVHVRLSPPLAEFLQDPSETDPILLALAKAQRRKPTYSWGWDFAPNLPSVGVWLPAELVTTTGPTITGRYIRTTRLAEDHNAAEVTATVEADPHGAATEGLTVTLTLTAPDGQRTATTVDLKQDATVRIDHPQLWWTNDLGAQPLYTATVELRANGQIHDTTTDHIGIRTIELDRRPDEANGGRLFRFVVNGVPIFARGANWVPPDMMIATVADTRLTELVQTAKRANMNMIRIWGGGIYERDAFYRAADEAGVLIWQDFMFACIDYPSDDPTLTHEVTEEAIFQVRRLRNHACLALWSGNNEVQGIRYFRTGNNDPGNWGYSFFHEVLPKAVADHSPQAIYWPGSPWGEPTPADINGTQDGDRHAWEVWHGLEIGAGGPTEFASDGERVHFERYRYDKGRFISEFGIHASPEAATLERWTAPGSLSLHSPAFDHRNKDNPKNKGDNLMDHETGLPADFDEYVELSMVGQAEGLKYGIEHYRRLQPLCSGTLFWQFNDPWPGFSWSVVDYDGVPKAGYYLAARAYAPVLASFQTGDNGDLELWLCNSTGEQADGDLRVEVVTYEDKPVLDETLHVSAAAGQSTRVWSARVEGGPDRVAWVSSPTGLAPDNRMFFGRLREQQFGDHTVAVTAVKDRRADNNTIEVEVTSTGYNYFTRLDGVPQPGTVMDRNYVDLRDGETVTFVLKGVAMDADLSGISVRSYKGSSK